MENTEKGNHILTNCTIDSATVKDLLDHLGVHGLMSLVASRKFAPYFSCVLRELDKAITEVDTPVAPRAGDGNGESRNLAASSANGPALLPPNDKVGAKSRRMSALTSVEAFGQQEYIGGRSGQSPFYEA